MAGADTSGMMSGISQILNTLVQSALAGANFYQNKKQGEKLVNAQVDAMGRRPVSTTSALTNVPMMGRMG